MVAHNVADVPLLFAVMVRRRKFFQEDPSILFLTLGLFIVPFDEVWMKPCFVIAALIGLSQAQSFMRNGKRHHEVGLSNNDQIRAVSGILTRQPSILESNVVPKMVYCQAALAKRSQQKLPQWY